MTFAHLEKSIADRKSSMISRLLALRELISELEEELPGVEKQFGADFPKTIRLFFPKVGEDQAEDLARQVNRMRKLS